MTHTLVGLLWCENGRFCTEFHHINGVKNENRKENILPCTHIENLAADEILRKCKKNPEDKALQAEYDEYIERIRTLNRENGEEFRVIIDPDDDTGNFHCYFVKKAAYDRFAESGSWADIGADDIVGECVDITVPKEMEE